MKKQRKPRWGYQFDKCPICKTKTFEYCSYSEFGWGTVEQHGSCSRCGFIVEQAYSPTFCCFGILRKGSNIQTEHIMLKMLKSIKE